MVPEKLLIWNEIKRAAPEIMKAGGNAIEILIWSQSKSLAEVRKLLRGEDVVETFQNVKNNDAWIDEEAVAKPEIKVESLDTHLVDQTLHSTTRLRNRRGFIHCICLFFSGPR